MKNVLVTKFGVGLILASEGDHEGRPYANVVGANFMFALARTSNGTGSK